MLIKLGCGGVCLDQLHPRMTIVLRVVTTIWDMEEPVITSTWDGTHSPGSLHPLARALDFRKPSTNVTAKVQELRSTLGKDYDVVLEDTHVHVEYDPK
jgi:hypothetical protein